MQPCIMNDGTWIYSRQFRDTTGLHCTIIRADKQAVIGEIVYAVFFEQVEHQSRLATTGKTRKTNAMTSNIQARGMTN